MKRCYVITAQCYAMHSAD